MTETSIQYHATWFMMLGSLCFSILFPLPWILPVLLILCGIISNFSNKRIPSVSQPRKPIRWMNAWLFVLLFIMAGICSEMARINQWEYGRLANLFENFYRFGTFVFGGGPTLMPMLLYQYGGIHAIVSRPELLSPDELMIGYGLVQAIPGPVFSICTFAGGLVMRSEGPLLQLAGCVIATIAVYLPTILLLFFFYPVYENLKKYAVIFRALEGFNAAIIGFIWASGWLLFDTMSFEWFNLIVILITFCLLQFSKIPAPLIVTGWLLLGLSIQFT